MAMLSILFDTPVVQYQVLLCCGVPCTIKINSMVLVLLISTRPGTLWKDIAVIAVCQGECDFEFQEIDVDPK